MKRNIFSKGKLVGLLLAFAIMSCITLHAQSPDNCTTFPTWNSGTAYNANDNVKHNNVHYKANWWTQGEDPATNSRPVGSGKPWLAVGACSGSVNNPPPGSYWDLNGNSDATSTSFIGTSNYIPLTLKSNNIVGLRVNPTGSVNIGEGAQDTWYYKFEVKGLTALTGPTGTNQTNLFAVYSGNTGTPSYAQGSRHYLGFSHGLFGTEEFSIINTYDYNRTLGTGRGKHMLIQNTTEGNLGIGVFSSAPVAKLHVNGTTFLNGTAQIGTQKIIANHNDYKLSVDGKIICRRLVATPQNWADSVFSNDYKLMDLGDLENYIQVNKKLPEIPSEAEVMSNGIEVGEMNMLLLKQMEERTLYIIKLEKRIGELENKE